MGRFPDFSGTISGLRLLAARPAALRLLRLAVPRVAPAAQRTRSPPAGAGTPSGPERTCMAAVRVPRLRWRRRDLPDFPGDPSPACPALHRSPTAVEPAAPGRSRRLGVAFRTVTASASTITTISGSNHAYASQPGSPRTTQHSVPAGWPALAGSGLPPAGSRRRFPSCHCMASSSTKLCLAQDGDVRAPARFSVSARRRGSGYSPRPRCRRGLA